MTVALLLWKLDSLKFKTFIRLQMLPNRVHHAFVALHACMDLVTTFGGTGAPVAIMSSKYAVLHMGQCEQ